MSRNPSWEMSMSTENDAQLNEPKAMIKWNAYKPAYIKAIYFLMQMEHRIDSNVAYFYHDWVHYKIWHYSWHDNDEDYIHQHLNSRQTQKLNSYKLLAKVHGHTLGEYRINENTRPSTEAFFSISLYLGYRHMYIAPVFSWTRIHFRTIMVYETYL